MGVNPIILYQMHRALTSTEPAAISFADLPPLHSGESPPMSWLEALFAVVVIAVIVTAIAWAVR